MRRVGENTARICDDVVGPQSAKIATTRFSAITHEAYDKLAYSNAEPGACYIGAGQVLISTWRVP